MAGSSVKAVTFDLWDTVFVDDSDEPRRAAVSLLSKRDERRYLVRHFLEKHEPVDPQRVEAAYDAADEAFHRVWYEDNVTWTVPRRLEAVLGELGRSLPADEMNELVRLHEEMELMVAPDTAPHLNEAIAALRSRYRLAVVSDTVFSPGRVLRRLLDRSGFKDCFEAFAFSDEVGCSKPRPEIFRKIFEELGVEPAQVVHLGDREEKDVAGAHAAGARAILVTVVKDRGSAGSTRAEAVLSDYRRLDGILQEMERG